MNTAPDVSSSSITPARLMSFDALRGSDMMWIVGAGGIVDALEKMSSSRFTTAMVDQGAKTG